MSILAWIFIGIYLIIRGLNEMGVPFTGDSFIKGLMLFLSGLFILIDYL